MQPIYRMPLPPQGTGMKTLGPPPSGSLPPPQRPPAGYRPSFPGEGSAHGQMPPAPGVMPNAPFSTAMKPPFNPPVEKMSAMNLDSVSPLSHRAGSHYQNTGSSFTTDPSQTLSNGVADISPLSSKAMHSISNGSQSTSVSNAQARDHQAQPSGSGPAFPHQEMDFLHSKTSELIKGESCSPSQSPVPYRGSQPSTPDINKSHPSFTNTSRLSTSFPSSSSPGFAPTFSAPSNMHPTSTSFNSPNFGPSPNNSMALSSSYAGQLPKPEMQMPLPRPGMPPVGPHMGLHGSFPTSSPMGPSFSGIPPTSQHMGPSAPDIPPRTSLIRTQATSLPSMGSGIAPFPSMPPSSSQLGPPPGMHIPPPGFISGPGMPPTNMHIGPPRPGMPPPSSYMSSPNAGMPPPTSSTLSSSMQSGMPPPPTSSYMPSTGSGMPSPGSHMGPNVPPGPNSMAPSPSAIGGMQNRYPGASPSGGPMGSYPQGTQGRRLNLDDMPSPLQVMEEDRQLKSGEFLTNMKGAVPPLVTTDFVVKDGGNASPRFLRSTIYNVPATQDMMKQASIPFGLVISPLAELLPNEAPLYPGTSLVNGPARCNRCKGYMSPLMMFMDGGRRFQCLLCKQVNEVPADYYCHMDSQGARADKYQRPELCLGSYEFVATSEYCKDKLLPKEPAFIFVFEMSQMMVQRGIISFLCQNMKSILKHLPKDDVPGQEGTKSSVRVGFITYDSSVHFYKLNGLAPEMCIVCDRENMFVPVADGVLCDVEEVADNIDKLMESIPQNFQTTRETSGALSCAIHAGMAALKASGRAGKLFVFHSSLPQFENLGKLKNREDRKLLGTDKEKAILSPQNTHYNNLAQDLVLVGCGVDLFIFNESYIDLATVGQVTRLTGGQVYKYTFFQPNKDSDRLLKDLKLNISRNIAFDSVMRVRTSTGVRPVEFYGHLFMSNTHDIELPVVDSTKAIAIEIKHDDKITEEDGVYIQVALLYTSVGGQRRLRIFNLALNICTQMADLYKNCDLDTLMNFFSKQSMFKFLESSAKQVKENLIGRTAQILACYRKNCASPSSVGQLILPELMKLLPLYVNCLSKCDALSGGQDLTCDDRSWHIYQLSAMTVEASVVYLYPRLIPLSDVDPQEEGIPPAIRTSYEKMSPDGVYLLENGLFMFMWVGSGTSSTWMKDVFGVSAPHQLDPVLSELPELDNPTSQQVRGIIEAVREQRKLHVRLFVVPQQGKHEVVMRNYLVEDKGVFGAPSYVDFLCHVHKEIRALLS